MLQGSRRSLKLSTMCDAAGGAMHVLHDGKSSISLPLFFRAQSLRLCADKMSLSSFLTAAHRILRSGDCHLGCLPVSLSCGSTVHALRN